MRRLKPLHAKLTRDLWRIKGQALAIMLVIGIGVALQVMMTGLVASLTQTRDAYYERHQFAQVFAPVSRAPEHIARQLHDIPGVATVQTRISGMALIDIPTRDIPVSARILSLPTQELRHLNEIRLTTGRRPDSGKSAEIVLLDSFAVAHDIVPGDEIEVTLNGARRTFDVVGTAQSPEFIYYAAPGEMIPDDARFGVIWIGRPALAAALDLEGAFNEALMTLLRGAVSMQCWTMWIGCLSHMARQELMDWRIIHRIGFCRRKSLALKSQLRMCRPSLCWWRRFCCIL